MVDGVHLHDVQPKRSKAMPIPPARLLKYLLAGMAAFLAAGPNIALAQAPDSVISRPGTGPASTFRTDRPSSPGVQPSDGVGVFDRMTKTVPTPHTRVLVLDVPMESRLLTLGLVADRVFEVTPFRREQIEAAPDIGVRWRSDYIAGVVRRENGFVVIIDLARLLSREDASALQSAA